MGIVGSSSTTSNESTDRNILNSESFSEEKDSETVLENGCLSIVVLGASGDLAKKKTFPALFNLYRQVCWDLLTLTHGW